MKNRSVEEIHIENLSKKRYEYFAMEHPDWDQDKEETLIPPEIQDKIDELGSDILKYIKLWQYALPFEFIFEELTKLGQEPNLLYDGDGNFIVCVEWEPKNYDDGWKSTIREALKYYLDEE